jgi:hypothetical protein
MLAAFRRGLVASGHGTAYLASMTAVNPLPGRLGYEHEFAEVHADIAGVRSDLRAEITALRNDRRTGFADVRADLRLLKWGQATTLAGVVAILLKLFIH